MKDAIQKLTRERDALENRLSEISQVLDEYAVLESRAKGLLSADQDYKESHCKGVSFSPSASLRQHEPLPEPLNDEPPTDLKEYEETLADILREADAPLKRKEVLNALKGRGVIVGGSNELNTLGTRLHRTEWVENLKGYGYWLQERDYPPAGYFTLIGNIDEQGDQPEYLTGSSAP